MDKRSVSRKKASKIAKKAANVRWKGHKKQPTYKRSFVVKEIHVITCEVFCPQCGCTADVPAGNREGEPVWSSSELSHLVLPFPCSECGELIRLPKTPRATLG